MRNNLVLALTLTIALCLGIALLSSHQTNIQLKKDLDYYGTRYYFKSGVTTMGEDTIVYQLATLDGGQNWYVISAGEDQEIKVVGPVEEIYPGLMERLNSLEALYNYVDVHPIDGSISPELARILRDIGFRTENK